MALNKTVTQKTTVIGKETELRSQIVELYRERVLGVDFNALDLKSTIEALKDREALAVHLSNQGKERESNTLRKETIRVLVTKAEAAEAKLFEAMRVLTENAEKTNEKRTALGEELKLVKQDIAQVQQDFKKKKAQLEKLDPESKEAKDLQAEMGELNETFKVSAQKGTEIQIQLQQMAQSAQVASATAEQASQEALTFKSGAVGVMMVMGNSDGAFALALETVDKFHEAGIFGLAENLVANALNAAEGRAENLFKEHTRQSDMHKLLELGIEAAVDVASRLEKAVFTGTAHPEVIEEASQFRLKAADLSAKSGNFADAKSLLLTASKEYREKGYSGQAVKFLEFALNLDEANLFAESRRDSELLNAGYL